MGCIAWQVSSFPLSSVLEGRVLAVCLFGLFLAVLGLFHRIAFLVGEAISERMADLFLGKDRKGFQPTGHRN